MRTLRTSRTPQDRAAGHCLEAALLAIGLVGLAWFGVLALRAGWNQAMHATALERRLAAGLPGGSGLAWTPREGDLVGRLEIPRVRLSVMVVEGDDDETLQIAAGHLPDTPWPWQIGNSAIAGHRDTFFRPLKNVRVHDAIRLVTLQGTLDYTVTSTRIVDADDLSVLDASRSSVLTLVTCYPFGLVGSAPQRFVVRGVRVKPAVPAGPASAHVR
jgi:sortase A